MPRLAIAGAALLTSACSTISTPPLIPQASDGQPSNSFQAPRVQQDSGVESVIGQSAARLTGRFGEVRIDLAEGDARKLQFASDRCVLDIYFYPLQANSEPVATHVEARERQGGEAFDKAQCIATLEQ